MNCFMIYKRDKKHAILKENPMINFRDISKIVADQWREEKEDVKEHYKNLAKIEMKNHQEKYPDYRFPSSKGKHVKKKASKLHTVLTQELKKSVGRPKKIPMAPSQDKSEKLQEYIKKLKSINGIQFQDQSDDGQKEGRFTIPDASDAIYKHRVLPPLVQNRGYITPVKSEFFIPIKNSPGNIKSTPVNSAQHDVNDFQGVSTLERINGATLQKISSPVQYMNRDISVGAQQTNGGMPPNTPLMNRNLNDSGNLLYLGTAQPIIPHAAPLINRSLPNIASPVQHVSPSPVQRMNRNIPGNAQQICTGTQEIGNTSFIAQQISNTLAQQQQNRTFASPLSQQMISPTASTSAPPILQNPSAVSHEMPNVRNPMVMINDHKMVKVEEVDKQIQRVGTPSTPVYNSYTSPISQAALMATPEQSPQNFMARGQFRSMQPIGISENSDSPNQISDSIHKNPSYFSNGGLEQAHVETVPNSPKRGRPRGASSPGQQFSFVCELCFSSFVRRHDLKRHLLLHSGLGPYRCSCGRHFSRQDFFARHMQTCRSKTILSPPESPALSVDEVSAPSQ